MVMLRASDDQMTGKCNPSGPAACSETPNPRGSSSTEKGGETVVGVGSEALHAQPFSRAARFRRERLGIGKAGARVCNERTLQFFRALVDELLDHGDAREFRVSDSEKYKACRVPLCRDVISEPMDLGTVRRNLAEGVYMKKTEGGGVYFEHGKCVADLFLVFRTRQRYSRQGSVTRRSAEKFVKLINERVQQHHRLLPHGTGGAPANRTRHRREEEEEILEDSGTLSKTEGRGMSGTEDRTATRLAVLNQEPDVVMEERKEESGAAVRPGGVAREAGLVGSKGDTKRGPKAALEAAGTVRGNGAAMHPDVCGTPSWANRTNRGGRHGMVLRNGAKAVASGSEPCARGTDMTAKSRQAARGSAAVGPRLVQQAAVSGIIRLIGSYGAQGGFDNSCVFPIGTVRGTASTPLTAGVDHTKKGVQKSTENSSAVAKKTSVSPEVAAATADAAHGQREGKASPRDSADRAEEGGVSKCAQGLEARAKYDRLVEARRELVDTMARLEHRRQSVMVYSEKKKLCEQVARLDYNRMKTVAIMISRGMDRPDLMNEYEINVDVDAVDNAVLRDIEFFLSNDAVQNVGQSLRQLESQILQVDRELRSI